MPERIVGEVRKSARESIRLVLREKRGDVGLDLRIAAANGRGEMCETAKGLRVPIAKIGALITALQDAQRLATPIEGRSLVRSVAVDDVGTATSGASFFG
ncbi:hypothetical protein IPV08_16955 [Methylobacterium sp. SD274]|uniref:hypothetical protein n=1 Tax=Methylobacterium sp. SD274 TaxID=2782009 RepID=UPI001A966212|nr:hypothetical protein [Methylobacterium sp. SD274]MBO1021651.1 hypothetical protein [Methylobacterium sp. SD274]